MICDCRIGKNYGSGNHQIGHCNEEAKYTIFLDKIKETRELCSDCFDEYQHPKAAVGGLPFDIIKVPEE